MQVPVLIDTGSMKSLLSSSVFQRISARCAHQNKAPPPLRSISNSCVSITGQSLNSSGSADISLSFPGSQFLYVGEFLVCDNVLAPLQCVLGWDFLTFYSLQLTVIGDSYCLVGPHGSTPLTPLSLPVQPPPPGLSAPVNSSCKEDIPVFVQSSDYGPVFVTLSTDISIPGRTESVIQAQIPKSCKEQIGKFLVAHHNQLKACPLPLGQGQPFHPVPETPGIIPREGFPVVQHEEMQGVVQRGTARPPHLRQVINPPQRYGEVVAH